MAGRSAHQQPVRGPSCDPHARSREALEVDVSAAAAPILPGDEDAVAAVPDDGGSDCASPAAHTASPSAGQPAAMPPEPVTCCA